MVYYDTSVTLNKHRSHSPLQCIVLGTKSQTLSHFFSLKFPVCLFSVKTVHHYNCETSFLFCQTAANICTVFCSQVFANLGCCCCCSMNCLFFNSQALIGHLDLEYKSVCKAHVSLSAPSGALYVMLRCTTKGRRPPSFKFSLSPAPQCRSNR